MTKGLSMSSASDPLYTYSGTKQFYVSPDVCESVEESKNKLSGKTTLTCNKPKFSSFDVDKEVSVFKGGILKKRIVYFADGTGFKTKFDAAGNTTKIKDFGKSKY